MEEQADQGWFYAVQGQQKGPISQVEFIRLVKQGVITADTLVWRSGMASWTAYGQLADLSGGAGDQKAPCHYCGRLFPAGELIEFNGTRVCAACKPVFVQQFKENAEIVSPLTRRYAGFWIRVGASILDSIISGILTQMMVFPVKLLIDFHAQSPQGIATIVGVGVNYLLSLTIGILYYIIPLAKYGATPGKMACGLKVIRSNGGPISYGRALGRYFGNMLSGLTLCIGYLMVAFDKTEHKALHDILCDTRVVYKGN